MEQAVLAVINGIVECRVVKTKDIEATISSFKKKLNRSGSISNIIVVRNEDHVVVTTTGTRAPYSDWTDI